MQYIKTAGKLVALTSFCLIASSCGGSGSSSSSGSSGSSGSQGTNSAPTATPLSQSLLQDSAAVSITLSATDPDGDSLTYSLAWQPSFGTAALSGNVVSYTPDADYAGTDSFTFKASDGALSSSAASVDLTINPASGFQGKIAEFDGVAVPNATVEALDASGELVTTVTADSDGLYSLKAETSQELTLKFSSDGYANQVMPVTMSSLKSMALPLDVVMMKRGVEQTLDINAGGALSGDNGASVTIAPNSFVDANGNSVSGDITATITPVDVSDPAKLAAFPGDFKGIEEMNGTETAIVSLGTAEYVFTQNGAPLQLADGATAEIILPMYSSINPDTDAPYSMGDSIDLWSLNEDTGIWTQEGSGIVVANTSSPTGLALKATVSHFTWWNCDIATYTADVDVTLTGPADTGAAIIHGRAEVSYGYRTGTTNITVGETVSGLIIPRDRTTCFWIEYLDTNAASTVSEEQCIEDAVSGTTYPLIFGPPVEGPLDIYEGGNNAQSYYAGRQINIRTFPISLETNVTYNITAGTLPAGLTLTSDSATSSVISGSTTVEGTYSITITGTDSDSYMDTRDITFSIVNPPPPTLLGVGVIYANSGDTISRVINVRSTPADDPTSWIVTNSDGSSVPAGVTISNSGELTIANFDGVSVIYHVTAYNAQGASNTAAVDIRDLATSPPILPSSVSFYYYMGETNFTRNLANYNSGVPATSWTITNTDGTPPPAGVTVSSAGILSIDYPTAYLQYLVKALNGTIASSEMTVSINEEHDPCMIDLNC